MNPVYFDVYKEGERLTAGQVTELFLNRRQTRGEVKLIEVSGAYAGKAATNHHLVSWIGMRDLQEVRAYRTKKTRVEIMTGGSIPKEHLPSIKIERTENIHQAKSTIEKYLPGCTLKEA